jgi:hypothetical protein
MLIDKKLNILGQLAANIKVLTAQPAGASSIEQEK